MDIVVWAWKANGQNKHQQEWDSPTENALLQAGVARLVADALIAVASASESTTVLIANLRARSIGASSRREGI